jgi:hypothetical protein
MSKSDPHAATTSESTPSPRRNGRPMSIGGGPASYLENALAAVAQRYSGIKESRPMEM